MNTKLNLILQHLEDLDIFPKLKCPFCDTGNLIAGENEKIRFANVSSEKRYDLVGEVTDLVGEYSYLLLCDNSSCEEKGIVVGKTNTIEDGYDDGIDIETGEELHHGLRTYKSKYKIDYLSIPVSLIEIPDNIPQNLKNCLESSFSLFWVDLNSCGNRLRLFVELLLDFINVPAKLTLDARIKELEKAINNPFTKLAKQFMAIKYFGNETTHTFNEIEKSDIVKSYRVIEFCLREIYSNYNSEIDVVTNELEDKFKPKTK